MEALVAVRLHLHVYRTTRIALLRQSHKVRYDVRAYVWRRRNLSPPLRITAALTTLACTTISPCFIPFCSAAIIANNNIDEWRPTAVGRLALGAVQSLRPQFIWLRNLSQFFWQLTDLRHAPSAVSYMGTWLCLQLQHLFVAMCLVAYSVQTIQLHDLARLILQLKDRILHPAYQRHTTNTTHGSRS